MHQSAMETSAARTGAENWADAEASPEAFARGLARSALAIVPARGVAFVSADSRELVLLDGEDGKVLWEHWPEDTTGEGILSLPERDGLPSIGIFTPCALSPTESIVIGACVRGDEIFARRALARLQALVQLAALWGQARAARALAGSSGDLYDAVQVLTTMQGESRAFSASLAVCNALCRSWGAERACLGFVRNGVSEIYAISHAEKIAKETPLARSIRSVMDECIDQDREVLTPPDPEDVVICQAGREHLRVYEADFVLAMPLRYHGSMVGVVVLEWRDDPALTQRRMQSLRLALDLVTPGWLALRENDRWIGARALAAARDSLSSLIGPRHTWAKAAALVVSAFLIFAFMVHGSVRVTADASLESIERRVASSPIDGVLESVRVGVGDVVEVGEELARVDVTELRLEIGQWRAEEAASRIESAIAKREGDAAGAQVADAAADRAAARRALAEERAERAVVRSGLDGVVTNGDLDSLIGSPVARGTELFVIEPIESLRAEILIPEGRVGEVEVGSTGSFAAASYPDERVGFTINRIDPIARVVDGENVFAARVTFAAQREWMRPGIEGVAKIDAGTLPYMRIWTRDIVNWLRMKLWI